MVGNAGSRERDGSGDRGLGCRPLDVKSHSMAAEPGMETRLKCEAGCEE